MANVVGLEHLHHMRLGAWAWAGVPEGLGPRAHCMYEAAWNVLYSALNICVDLARVAEWHV